MTDRSTLLKLVARRTGQAITVLSLSFLVWALYRQQDAIIDWKPTAPQIALLVLLAFVYSGALMLLALNWVTIVRSLISQSLPRAPILLSYTKTQIAKYIPGNVLHLVSRHIYLKNFGLDHRPVASGSLLELVSLPVAAVIAICIVMPIVGDMQLGSWELDAWALLLLIASVCVSALAIWRTKRTWLLPVIVVVCRGVIFMVCQGTIFAIVLYMVSGTFIMLAVPAAIFAWLVGFLTPGAPGGIAVREALLVGLLTHTVADDAVFIAALILRMITTTGDLILYQFGNMVVVRHLTDK
jgi:hypothetical protein